jgi:hypothetical protein
MTGVVHTRYSGGHRISEESLTDAALRWVLPATASVSLSLGVALLLSRGSIAAADVSLGLFLTGWGASAALVAVLCRGQFKGARRGAETMEVSVTPAPDGGPSWLTRPETVSRPAASFSNRGSEWRVLAAPTGPGDETWLSWLPRESRRLGADTGKIGRGAVYSPGGSGSLVAFPTRKESSSARSETMAGDFARSKARIPPSPEVPPASTRRSGFSEEDLDRMFPPTVGGRSLFLSEVPDKIGVPLAPSKIPNMPVEAGVGFTTSAVSRAGRSQPLGADVVARSPGSPPAEDSTDLAVLSESPSASLRAFSEDSRGPPNPVDELFREAVNPVPPHLRGARLPTHVGSRRPDRPRRDTSNPKSVCASCSKVVVTLRMSGPCPKCLRPICNECLREAFVTHGQGWCIDCSSTPAVSAS